MDKNNNISDFPTTDYRASIKLLRRSGFFLSGAWLLIAFLLVLWKRDTLSELTLNELGDFMAGVSAPLALLWVIVGYFQQGIELRQNTETLKLQQQELARQVHETATLARNSDRQAAAAEHMAQLSREQMTTEKLRRQTELQPAIRMDKWIHGPSGPHLRLVNNGSTVEKVRFVPLEGIEFEAYERPSWEMGQHQTLECRTAGERSTFAFEFTDEDGDRWHHTIEVRRDGTLERKKLQLLGQAP